MPEISRFLGIVIFMRFSEHNPPHIHVRYNEFKATMGIRDLGLMGGKLPPRVCGLVTEWVELHREELLGIWDSGEFNRIPPLV
jgi:hypothetical protein